MTQVYHESVLPVVYICDACIFLVEVYYLLIGDACIDAVDELIFFGHEGVRNIVQFSMHLLQVGHENLLFNFHEWYGDWLSNVDHDLVACLGRVRKAESELTL